MQGVIYLIQNKLNNKCYVGKTTRNLGRRWGEHKRDAVKYTTRPLYRAINKYGIENFTITKLGEYALELLNSKEQEYIRAYNSYGSTGYNATKGGEGSLVLEVEPELLLKQYKELGTLEKVANLYCVDRSTIGLRIKDIDGVGVGHNNLKPHLNKKVYCKTLDLNFESLTACAQYLIDIGICTGTAISVRKSLTKACTGSRKTYKKLEFKYI